MGVPKFFRYISERYPCLSEIVKEYQIPEFDNMYLDMNGIIHMCSHPDDGDPHFRISEEKIFQDIFHYIEVLFRMIRPRKLFFMAIDGVAPRAKMNQQRARRFRSAKEMEKLEEKARKKGEVLPDEARFDSNCITPGTTFMANLHEQLKYFVVCKISKDKLWQKCQIVLSGHETPGEGEHKIMDYIRYMRSQTGYDPNTRHCLYGLDADLIMLGLCTHEPHFSLLREEVKFGRKSTKRKSTPEEITFYLLHLSLMREYLELEFKELDDAKLSFGFDIEKIIDDWVLMGFLVGNDFIPHLPNLHITNGALPLLYKTYMQVLPSFDGYINEAGTLHLGRFEKFMEVLAGIDLENFQETYADLKYFEGKTGRRPNETQRKSYKFGNATDVAQNEDENNLIEFDDAKPEKPMDSDLEALIKGTEDMFSEPLKTNSDLADVPEIEDDFDPNAYDSDASDEMFQLEFKQHKRDYYTNKLAYENVTPEVLRAQAEGYVRAIQWNLHYYYNGVCSWSWFYAHHYAPYISDIKGFADLKLEFDLGTPFRPYEQLLAVLPAASKELLPLPYQKLMVDPESLISEYYPEDFQTDLNGKRQEWEAVVLIPFIDEDKLLRAMEPCELLLTLEEVRRNTHGPMLIYKHTSSDLGRYEAPQYFPPVAVNHACCVPVTIEQIRIPQENLVKGPYPGVRSNVYYLGFPTLKHLKFSHSLGVAHVKVHEQPSRGENMILSIKSVRERATDEVAREVLGKTVFVAWPHLVEAFVLCVSDINHRYNSTNTPGDYNVVENTGNLTQSWEAEKNSITEYYRNRFGIEVGNTTILVHVKVMIGRKYTFTSQGRVTLEKQWAPIISAYPLQSVVRNIPVHDDQFSSFKDVESVFPVGSICFMLGHPHYGSLGEVKDSKESLKNNRIKVNMKSHEEPTFDDVKDFERDVRIKYMTLYKAASRLGISKNLFTRITGSIFVSMHSKLNTSDDTNKVNIGLNLKFSKKNEEVPGYTRREDNIWYYSEKAMDLVKSYNNFCPDLFEHLNLHNNNVYFVEDLFPDQNGKDKIDEILSWIKQQPFYSLERRPCGSMMLDLDVVKHLEETVDKFNAEKTDRNILMQVKPHLLYKPDLNIGNIVPDESAHFQLYDRVVNIRESYTVPLGLRGTVIALHKPKSDKEQDSLYDVVFDEPFAGGLTLNCSPNRGYRLPKPALINKSHGQREYERKTCKQAKLVNQTNSDPIGSNNMGNALRTHPSMSQSSAFATCYYPPPIQQRYTQVPSVEYMMSNQQFQPPFLPPQVQQPMTPPQVRFVSTFANSESQQNFVRFEQYSRPYQQEKPGSSPRKQQQQHQQDERQYSRPITKSQDRDRPDVYQIPNPNNNKVPRAPKVDTDFLKKMLRIETPKKATSETQKPNQTKKLTVDDIFTHAKSKNIPLSEAKSAYRSVQLLHYYQANGLGCPHYSYFDLPDKTIQAQLINPLSGQVVCGKPSVNKTEACENVAAEVLNVISQGNMVSSYNKLAAATTMPVPPKMWFQHKQGQVIASPSKNTKPRTITNSRDNGCLDVENKKPTQTATAPAIETIAASKFPFTPLQAVVQHKAAKNVTAKQVDYKEMDASATDCVGGVTDASHASNQNMQIKLAIQEPIKIQKPRRERKMRIAANFQIKPVN